MSRTNSQSQGSNSLQVPHSKQHTGSETAIKMLSKIRFRLELEFVKRQGCKGMKRPSSVVASDSEISWTLWAYLKGFYCHREEDPATGPVLPALGKSQKWPLSAVHHFGSP